MKNKTGVLVLMLMFALALGAGVVAGKLTTHRGTAEPGPVRRGGLPDILELSSDQRQKMETIWLDVRDTSQKCLDDAKKVQRDQDDALMKMLTEDQKKQYAELTQQSAARIAVLDARRKERFKKAVDASMLILNDDQRKTYKQIIKDRVGNLPDASWDSP